MLCKNLVYCKCVLAIGSRVVGKFKWQHFLPNRVLDFPEGSQMAGDNLST